MKQFRDTRYWVKENGEVWSKTDAYNYTYITNHRGANGILKRKECTVKRPEKWKQIKLQDNGHGYLRVGIGNGKYRRVHQLVAELYTPGYFEGAEVDHIDCNKHNNHYTNLQWCTPEYNRKKGNNPDYPLFTSDSK